MLLRKISDLHQAKAEPLPPASEPIDLGPLSDPTEADRIRKNPAAFMREYLGEEPWQKQVEVCQSVVRNSTVLVNGCHALGKTWLAARIALWGLCSFPGARVITTGPGFRVVRQAVWREIGACLPKLKAKIPAVKDNQTQIEITPTWFAVGVSSNDPGYIQGIGHGRLSLVIVDEASVLNPKMWPGILSLIASGNSKLVCISNPVGAASQYARMWQSAGPDTARLRVSAFDTPNFAAAGVKDTADLQKYEGSELVAPHLITPAWAKRRLVEWGEKSIDYRARVLALFPRQAKGSVINRDDLDRAFDRDGFGPGSEQERIHGLDVAYMGDDLSALASGGLRYGHPLPEISVWAFDSWGRASTDETADRAAAQINKNESINIDKVGFGAGTFDRLALLGYDARGIGFGEAPEGEAAKGAYANKRAQAYFFLARLLEKDLLHLGRVKHLRAEISNGLAHLIWRQADSGKQRLEPKDKAKARAAESGDPPTGFDYADALALMCFGRQSGRLDSRPRHKTPARHRRGLPDSV